jgi:hypothetical protein
VTGAEWVPAIVAIGTVVGNAFITHSAVSRHERRLDAHDTKLAEHGESLAGLKAVAAKENPP